MRGFDLWAKERENAELLENGLRVLRNNEHAITVKMWKPKAKNPFARYRFQSVEAREKFIEQQINGFNEYLKKKEERKNARKPTAEKLASVKVGDIFLWTWGYDQTNLDYFQVIAKKGQMVIVREIAQESVINSQGFMSERRIPIPGKYIGEPIKKRLLFSDGSGKPYLSQKFGWCGFWDGEAHYCSWYA